MVATRATGTFRSMAETSPRIAAVSEPGGTRVRTATDMVESESPCARGAYTSGSGESFNPA